MSLRFNRGSLGLKLNLALVFFFLMLGGLTTALIYYGFNRTQDNATARSQEALEELGELALLGVVAGQAEYGGLAFEGAADMGHYAAEYLTDFGRSGAEANFDTSRLTRNEDGVTYDPDPNRITDLAMPNYVELTPEVLAEIEYSAALDAIVPALLKNFPDSIREENFNPIAFAFIGVNNTVRYFPSINVHENVPPDLDLTALAKRLGPEGNPERKLLWQAPYEDSAGQGLIMTVEVPIYDGDTYKGAFQIDLSLDKLVEQVDQLKLTSVGFAFYVDSRGDVIPTDSKPLIDAEVEAGNAGLSQTLEAMRNNQEGVNRVDIGVDQMFIGYSPIEGVGGSLAVAASVEELTASAAAITAGIDEEGTRTLRVTLLAMAALFAVGLIGATYLNRRVLVRPIQALVAGTRAVAQGNFDTRIAIDGNDELAGLGHSFNNMTSDIQREVRDREAVQEELRAVFAAMTDRVVVVDNEGRFLRVPQTGGSRLIEDLDTVEGKLLADVRPPEVVEVVLNGIREALASETTVIVEFPYDLPDGRHWLSGALSPLSPTSVVAVMRDITERVNSRQELERQVEERTRELTALLRIANDVASQLELAPLLDTIIGQVRSIADYTRSSIFLVDGDSLVLANSRTDSEGAPVTLRISLASIAPIWARVGQGEAAIIEDVRGDSEMAMAYREASGDLIDTAFRDIRAWLGVPLALKDRIIGMLTLSHSQPAFYTERHAGLVSAIATQIAVAIENARLYEQAQQLAAVEERQRLARELHDSVSQALYGIALGARTARTLLDTDPPRATEPMDYVLQLADAGLAEMRALIFELRPESLETEGLVAALEKQIAATRARYGIEVDASLSEEPSLTLIEKEVFYRVAQESLHNVVKHAHASHVEVLLATSNGSVRLEVRDNGDGFDATQSFPGHMGLVSFTERANSIGARVAVLSRPGAGTTVRLTLGDA